MVIKVNQIVLCCILFKVHCSEDSPVSSWSPLNCKITVGSIPDIEEIRKDDFILLYESI